MQKFVLALAIVFTATAANAQSGKVKEYIPGTQTPAQAVVTKTDPSTINAKAQVTTVPLDKAPPSAQELAQKKLATWTDTKVACYRAVQGATEGMHWRLNPDVAGDIQTHSSLWTSLPASVHAEFAKCKAKKVE